MVRRLISLLAAGFLLGGCSTTRDRAAPDEERARYEPRSDRPQSARDYWAMREFEDRIEAAREGSQTRRP